MSDFASKHCPNYHNTPFDFSLPEDLLQEDNYKQVFVDSLLGDNLIWGGNEGSFRHQAKFGEPKEDLLSKFYENYYAPQHYRNDEHHELDFTGFQSKPNSVNEFSAAYYEYPSHAVLGLNFCPPYHPVDSDKDYDRMWQVWSASLANLGDLRNDFGKDSEDIGSILERIKNSILMEKDKTHIFGDNADLLSSGNNATGKFSEDFPHFIDTYLENLALKLSLSETKKQPVQNTSMAVETGENCRNTNRCNYGEQLKAELLQIISSLTANVDRLEIQVEHLTHKVKDMAEKLFGENNKFSAPMLDRSAESKAVLEESEATNSKFFIVATDSNQKSYEKGWSDDSYATAFDWEII